MLTRLETAILHVRRGDHLMRCPHCGKEIAEAEVSRHFAARGGRVSRRTITPEQQAKMQAGRKRKRDGVE